MVEGAAPSGSDVPGLSENIDQQFFVSFRHGLHVSRIVKELRGSEPSAKVPQLQHPDSVGAKRFLLRWVRCFRSFKVVDQTAQDSVNLSLTCGEVLAEIRLEVIAHEGGCRVQQCVDVE